VLFVRNDRDPEVDEQHSATLRAWRKGRISTVEVLVPRPLRPLSLTAARVFAFHAVQRRGWEPSPDAPVWFLDEDFCFEVLLPSIDRGFRRAPGGALLHRLEALATYHGPRGVDALVGGNSGAAPVPALGTIRRQLLDLVRMPNPRVEAGPMLSAVLRRRDAYYDLTTDTSDEVHVPPLRAWWRDAHEWTWDEVVERMMLGLPVSRPALPSLEGAPSTAWGQLDTANIAGGNTVLLSPRALRPDAFVQIRWGSVRSRRGDTAWSINCQRSGAKIARVSLPLLHDRAPRRGMAVFEAAVRDALADAMGVGLYETLNTLGHVDCREVQHRSRRRLAEVVQNLAVAVARLETAEHVAPAPQARLLRFLRDAGQALSAAHFADFEQVDRLMSDVEEDST
jgi:hypothetical protein